jgi:hypothetical protein
MSGLWKWDRNRPPCCGRVHEDCCAMEGDEVAVAIAGRPTTPNSGPGSEGKNTVDYVEGMASV